MSHIVPKVYTQERRLLERIGQAHGSSGSPNLNSMEMKSILHEILEPLNAQLMEKIEDRIIKSLSDEPEEEEVVTDEEVLEAEKKVQQETKKISYMENELYALSYTIDSVKKEIAHLYRPRGDDGNRIEDVAYELDVVVKDTESATQNIMDLAEEIDDLSNRLASAAGESKYLLDISEQITNNTMRMFESCNFQDLTGQRITKVVNTLKLIEEKIKKIIEIWGMTDMSKLTVEADPKGVDGLNKTISVHHSKVEKIDQSKVDSLMSQDDLDELFS